MKKLFTFIAFALLVFSAAKAQNYKTYDFKKCQFPIIGIEGDNYQDRLYGFFTHVSANGKYAVGTDDDLNMRPFVWNAENPDVIESPGEMNVYDGVVMAEIALYDVANDGTLVGGQRDENGVMWPAYKPANGNWQRITRGMSALNVMMAMDDYTNMAIRAVTPDGKTMVGSFYMNTGEVNNGIEVSHLVPVVFEDGKVKKIYDDLGIYEFMVWDISDDGRIICGMNTAGGGGHNPALIIDGKLINLFECGPEWSEEMGDDYEPNFAGGICNNIDNMGNIYGYYDFPIDEYSAGTYYFVIPSGEAEPIITAESYTEEDFKDSWINRSWYVCGGNGKSYTRANSHLTSLLDCSDDGKVLVGGGAASMAGGTFNTPMLTVFDEPQASAIDRVSDAKSVEGISLNGRTLAVKGAYSRAEVYNAAGALVASAGQGQFMQLPAASGSFIVKVNYKNGVKTYKVAK